MRSKKEVARHDKKLAKSNQEYMDRKPWSASTSLVGRNGKTKVYESRAYQSGRFDRYVNGKQTHRVEINGNSQTARQQNQPPKAPKAPIKLKKGEIPQPPPLPPRKIVPPSGKGPTGNSNKPAIKRLELPNNPRKSRKKPNKKPARAPTRPQTPTPPRTLTKPKKKPSCFGKLCGKF